METVNKEAFREWKALNPITQVVFRDIRDLIRQYEEELGATAGENPIHDAKKSGIILGLRTVLDMEVEDD